MIDILSTLLTQYSDVHPVFLLHNKLARGGSVSDSFLANGMDLVSGSSESVFSLDGNPYFFARTLFWAAYYLIANGIICSEARHFVLLNIARPSL